MSVSLSVNNLCPQPLLGYAFMDFIHFEYEHRPWWGLDAQELEFWSVPIWPTFEVSRAHRFAPCPWTGFFFIKTDILFTICHQIKITFITCSIVNCYIVIYNTSGLQDYLLWSHLKSTLFYIFLIFFFYFPYIFHDIYIDSCWGHIHYISIVLFNSVISN